MIRNAGFKTSRSTSRKPNRIQEIFEALQMAIGSTLDLADIQGNVLRGYPWHPFARFMLYRIGSAERGREFLKQLLPLITPGECGRLPDKTTNVGITFPGLRALALPFESLASFPPDFQQGMRARADLLGDTGDSDPKYWDPSWKSEPIHLVVMVYATDETKRDARCGEIENVVLTINSGAAAIESLQHQSAQWLVVAGTRTRKEHFGFVDGISNPDVEGVPDNGPGVDIGNPDDQGGFHKIPAGEFILGYPGEGGEVAPLPLPHLLGRNGTYLVIRKLEQRVVQFRDFLKTQAPFLPGIPSGVDPEDFLAAKMLGRWQDGSPLVLFPDKPEGNPGNLFKYGADMQGASCPLGAHIRRAYPRDSLGFDGKLVSRRRLIRRGIPYGSYLPDERVRPGGNPAPHEVPADEKNRRGIMFLAFNSGFDQFEFVQGSWINQGDDFNQGNDKDPIAGGGDDGRMVIPGDEGKRRRPFLCSGIRRFVITKGGDYFFVPSLTGLRLLAAGQVAVS
jgi:Dyp-type peroxidase family